MESCQFQPSNKKKDARLGFSLLTLKIILALTEKVLI